MSIQVQDHWIADLEELYKWEQKAIKDYTEVIIKAVQEGDETLASVFREILSDEIDHAQILTSLVDAYLEYKKGKEIKGYIPKIGLLLSPLPRGEAIKRREEEVIGKESEVKSKSFKPVAYGGITYVPPFTLKMKEMMKREEEEAKRQEALSRQSRKFPKLHVRTTTPELSLHISPRKCPLCGLPIKKEEIVIPYEDKGWTHKSCFDKKFGIKR